MARTSKTRCAGCYESGIIPRVPTRDALKQYSPEGVNKALISGATRFQGSYLSFPERHAVAEFVTGKAFGAVTTHKGICDEKASVKPISGELNGWSTDLDNSRFQSARAAGRG